MIGKTLGHYQISSQLGKGGMGEVYVADDLNLNRKVALKFLPDAFAGDPERMARFEREAKLLASLNHPNIAAIYGLEQAEGKRFIVMELVEGETLAQRISKGALPTDDALAVCRQIADGLEAAHEKGVIHRDLKPANVMITDGDKVKILDFGLAKALSDETQTIDSSQSPTLTEAMTRPGVILGTAAYMSPEQAKGKTVDKRADIWAFGCILYECLTGKRAFEGETVTETLAAVLTKDPEWDRVPPGVLPLLRSCIEKNPSYRLRDIGDAWKLLEETAKSAPAKRPWPAWTLAAALAVAFCIALWAPWRLERTRTEPLRFQISLPDKMRLAGAGAFALSPDGRRLVFAATGSDGIQRLWLRALDSLDIQPLSGTESKWIPPFFWSPDSRFVVFCAGLKLKKTDVIGGSVQTVCDLTTHAIGGSWNRDGTIIFGTMGGGLMCVSAAGGAASALTTPDPARQESQHLCPTFLQDGRHFLYFCSSRTRENQGIYLGSLDPVSEEQRSRLLDASSAAIYMPSADSATGQLLYLREQALIAQPFDEERLQLAGEAVTVAEQVGSFAFWGWFTASTGGRLIYRSGSNNRFMSATWFDRQGRTLGTEGETGIFFDLAISPEGKRAATRWVSNSGGAVDLWLLDFTRDINTRFTFNKGISVDLNKNPVWSPDGKMVAFASNREGIYNLYQKVSSGAKEEELLLKSGEHKAPSSWSTDGRFLMYAALDPKTNNDLWVLPLEGDRRPAPFLKGEFNESDGRFSPNMRWVAYVSDESGRSEVYVRAFAQASQPAAETTGKWQISVEGGVGPRWRRDGKELYYRAPDGKVMAVDVIDNPVFQPGTPELLFESPPADISTLWSVPCWDAASDGRFLLATHPSMEPTPFTVILNWTASRK